MLRDNIIITHQPLEETLDTASLDPPDLPRPGSTTNNLNAFSSPVPWHKTIITSSVLGKVDVNFGTLDLLLTLTNSQTISDTTPLCPLKAHSYVLPGRRFTLAEYPFDPTATTTSVIHAARVALYH